MASATAEVALAGPWHRERSGSGTGDGPIAATYRAIGEVVGRSVEVVNLSLRSVTPGKDSVGHVFVQVRVDGKTLTGTARPRTSSRRAPARWSTRSTRRITPTSWRRRRWTASTSGACE